MFGLFGKKSSRLTMNEARMELDKDKRIVLIDVRTREEFRQGHIKGSINIPLDSIPAVMGQKIPDKNTRIFVYCQSGARSSHACRWMVGSGYVDVTNIGGIYSWNGPIVRG